MDIQRRPTGYAAGPLIFIPGAFKPGGIMDQVKDLFHKHHLDVLTPLDNHANLNRDAIAPGKLGEAIARGDYGLVDRADFVLANLTPWLSDAGHHYEGTPSADVGTVAEAAYALGKGKPVFSYTNSALPYYQRVENQRGVSGLAADPDMPAIQRLPDGTMVDVTGGFDNLMLPAIAPLSGGTNTIQPVADPAAFYTDLTGLDKALGDAEAYFSRSYTSR